VGVRGGEESGARERVLLERTQTKAGGTAKREVSD